jgi:two-component system chemotaxis response regulator CheY
MRNTVERALRRAEVEIALSGRQILNYPLNNPIAAQVPPQLGRYSKGRDAGKRTGLGHRRAGFVMNSIRALIVDDSSVMRKIVERSLRQAGMELEQVLEAANGAEALVLLKNNHVDIILCDINMPVMDGLEFIKQLPSVANAKGVPVVMITTEGSEGHVVQAISAGARGYIRKPFTADQVKEQIIPMVAGKS